MQNDVSKEVAISLKQAEAIVKQSKVEITDAGSLQHANDAVRDIRKMLKSVQERKMAMLRPLKVTEKEIRDFFRKPEELLTEAEDDMKAKILVYVEAVGAANKEKEAELTKQVVDGKVDLQTAVNQLSAQTETATTDNTSLMTHRYAKVVDVKQVPREYLEHEKVLEAIVSVVRKDALEGVDIPGITVLEEKRLRILSER